MRGKQFHKGMEIVSWALIIFAQYRQCPEDKIRYTLHLRYPSKVRLVYWPSKGNAGLWTFDHALLCIWLIPSSCNMPYMCVSELHVTAYNYTENTQAKCQYLSHIWSNRVEPRMRNGLVAHAHQHTHTHTHTHTPTHTPTHTHTYTYTHSQVMQHELQLASFLAVWRREEDGLDSSSACTAITRKTWYWLAWG